MVSFSCQDSENTIDTVLDYETGAILRTISVDSQLLNASDANSLFCEKDMSNWDGDLLQETELATDYKTIMVVHLQQVRF